MKYMKNVIEKANGKMTLGETTPIRMGLVLIIIGILIAGVWRAAEISTKLDMVMLTTAAVKDDTKLLRDDLDNLKASVKDDNKSIQFVERSRTRELDDIRKELSLLREEFKNHANLNGAKRQ